MVLGGDLTRRTQSRLIEVDGAVNVPPAAESNRTHSFFLWRVTDHSFSKDHPSRHGWRRCVFPFMIRGKDEANRLVIPPAGRDLDACPPSDAGLLSARADRRRSLRGRSTRCTRARAGRDRGRAASASPGSRDRGRGGRGVERRRHPADERWPETQGGRQGSGRLVSGGPRFGASRRPALGPRSVPRPTSLPLIPPWRPMPVLRR